MNRRGYHPPNSQWFDTHIVYNIQYVVIIIITFFVLLLLLSFYLYIYYLKLHFLNNVIIIKTKEHLPYACITLADVSYLAYAFLCSCSFPIFGLWAYLMMIIRVMQTQLEMSKVAYD